MDPTWDSANLWIEKIVLGDEVPESSSWSVKIESGK